MTDSKAQQVLVEMRAALEGCRRTTEPVMRLLLGYGGRSAVLIADAVHRADTRARTALDTATSVIEAGLGEDGWRAKPLEWREVGTKTQVAATPFGGFEITDFEAFDTSGLHVRLNDAFDYLSKWFSNVEDAKAAAQADYETRIRSALLPTSPSTKEPQS